MLIDSNGVMVRVLLDVHRNLGFLRTCDICRSNQAGAYPMPENRARHSAPRDENKYLESCNITSAQTSRPCLTSHHTTHVDYDSIFRSPELRIHDSSTRRTLLRRMFSSVQTSRGGVRVFSTSTSRSRVQICQHKRQRVVHLSCLPFAHKPHLQRIKYLSSMPAARVSIHAAHKYRSSLSPQQNPLTSTTHFTLNRTTFYISLELRWYDVSLIFISPNPSKKKKQNKMDGKGIRPRTRARIDVRESPRPTPPTPAGCCLK